LPAFHIDPAYEDRMRAVEELICNRTGKLQEMTRNMLATDNVSMALRTQAANLSRRAQALENESDYYSAASYCFRTNSDLDELGMRSTNASGDEIIRKVFVAIAKLNKETDARQLRTLTDLETYMSVEERILETADTLVDASKAQDPEEKRALAAYAEERLVSAQSWTAFFGLPGQAMVLDQEALRRSCFTKIAEAEERFSYVRTYFPDALQQTRTTLDRAHDDATNQSYALCLSMAAKAKAEADVILSAQGFEEDQVAGLIALKMHVAQRQLIEAEQTGAFPLIGYNYYQYANDIKDEDQYSALLFSEYAIELSNLDIYFQKPRSPLLAFFGHYREVDTATLILIIVASAAAGAAVAFALVLWRRHPSHSREEPAVLVKDKPSPTPLAKRRRGKKR
jgi:predicted S18 family serine protease